MIKTLNPYSTTTAKTAEIMSRYRPIAPKPDSSVDSMSSESPKIKQSPYLRNLWPQLQARPTRTRKRGRTSMLSPPSLKRARTHHHVLGLGLSPPTHIISPAKNLSLHGFAHHGVVPQLQIHNLEHPNPNSSLVTLPLLPCTPVTTEVNKPFEGVKVIDLNTVADQIPEEKDLLLQLQGPSTTSTTNTTNVISPQPVRPVGSSISVGCINEGQNLTPAVQVSKRPEEVEEEVESETLPAVISDSNNKVRMANSAFKEMVGQPECPWLDSMMTGKSGAGSSASSCKSKRICGEVMLHFSDSRVPAVSSKGFSCWVRIEWGSDGKKSSINAFCDVNRLSCESKDYLFTWRFHTPYGREASSSQSSCYV